MFIFKKTYLVRLGPTFDGSASSFLTVYQKILWGGSLGCKSILNFTCLTMISHNHHHANQHFLPKLSQWVCYHSQSLTNYRSITNRGIVRYFVSRVCLFVWISTFHGRKVDFASFSGLVLKVSPLPDQSWEPPKQIQS